MKIKMTVFSIIFSLASGALCASNSFANVSLSTGRIAISVQGQMLTVGQTIQGQASLDAPIICPNGSNPCDVEFTITSSNPSDLTVSPQTITWNSNEWFQVRSFSIFANFAGFNAASENVSLTFAPAVSASQYYSGYVPVLTPAVFTISNPGYQAPAAPVPDPIQTSSVTTYSPETVTADSPVAIKVSGLFDRTISNISLNGKFLSSSNWQQSLGALSISLPAVVVGPNELQIFNGAIPVLQPLMITGTPPIKAQVVVKAREIVKYIQCVNGSHIRIAYGVSPTCSVGYARK